MKRSPLTRKTPLKRSRFKRSTPVKSQTPLYLIWQGMRDRCHGQSSNGYSRYGARGIAICDRWRGAGGFENFAADMGPRPSPKHSIDRINNDGNYEPGNCRWATRQEQASNRRCNIRITLDGETMCAEEWSRRTGLAPSTIIYRYRLGLPPEAILHVGTLSRAAAPWPPSNCADCWSVIAGHRKVCQACSIKRRRARAAAKRAADRAVA